MNIQTLYPLFVIVAFFSSILVLFNHRILFYIILFSSFFLDNIFYMLGEPATYDLIIDVFIIVYFIYAITKPKRIIRTQNNNFERIIKKYLTIFFPILFVINIITVFFNHTPLVLVVRSFLNFFRYVLLFYALLKLENNSDFYYRIFNIIIIIGLIQIPYSILQYIFYKGISFDFKGGSLSIGGYSTNGGAVFVAVFSAYYFIKYRFTDKKKYLILSLLFVLPIIISSAKVGFVFVLINIFFYYLFLEKASFSKYVNFLFMSIFFSIILYYLLFYVMPLFDVRNYSQVEILRDPLAFESYTFTTTKMGSVNRLQFFIYWFDNFHNNFLHFLFGEGLGSYTAGNVLKIYGMGIQHYGRFFTGLHSFAYFALELGFVNLLMYFFYLSKIIIKVRKAYRKVRSFESKLLLAFVALLLFSMIYSSVYWKVWALHGLAFTQWFLLAALIRLDSNFVNVYGKK